MNVEALAAGGGAALPSSGGFSGTTTSADFGATLERARGAPGSASQPGGLLAPLLNLNTESMHLADSANRASAVEMRPSELMTLTVQSHEFLFHCQLVSNVANRSADGLQQLFRQQS